MALAEEFVACKSNYGAETEDEEEGNEALCDDAPDHVRLLDPVYVHFWLRLVELPLDDGPTDCVDERLNQDDAARPAVQKVEMQVRDARQETENGIAGREAYRKRRESVPQSADAVAKAS